MATAPNGSDVPRGAPDLVDLARMANEFFSAVPGLDGLGRGPSLYGVDSGAAAARQAATLGVATPPPVSFAGAGFSPTGVDPESFGLNSVPAAERVGFGSPGAAIPPAGVSSFGPGNLQTSADFAPPGFDVTHALPSFASTIPGLVKAPDMTTTNGDAPIAGNELYILAESRSRAKATTPPNGDLPSVEHWSLDHGQDMARPAPSPIATPTLVDPAIPSASSGARHPARGAAFDVNAVRREFPILSEKVHGRPLIWLDNGATTQKPQAVIDRLSYFYEHENSNVHRAAHTLAARATDAYENARKIVARFIGAGSPDEIVFTRGATEAINLVASSWGRANIGAGDDIIISHLEHHANIVPWQQLAIEKSANLKIIPVDDSGQVRLDEYEKLLSDRTKIVAVTHVSNALGTVVPIKAIIDRAHAAGAKALIDGAQSIAHERVNMQWLDADFFVFSGHKIFAPTGIGALYGKKALLDAMPPWQTGGNMIADVTFEKTRFQPAPARFEAGTGNLADAVGLGEALEFIERIGLESIAAYEHELHAYATQQLKSVPTLRLLGSAPGKVSVLSFLLGDIPPEHVGRALDGYGIAVRAGHHCAQPILRRFGVEGTVRASLALYNTHDEIDCLVTALRQIVADAYRRN